MGEIYWAKASFLNFGDDLNLWLWPRLFPKFFNREDQDQLVGIGTILNNKLPQSGRLFIMGSGAGYGALPPPEQRKHWNPIFVRGPLTARVLGLPAGQAVTDGAFLAAGLFPRPATRRGGIFIPHWKSEVYGDWRAVCDYAGLRHVSPMQPVETVMSEIAGAELVITESMHGAILADAFRVPWVAVRTSSEINDFKWIDWCMSVGETYEPLYIPPSGYYDRIRQGKSQSILTEETFKVSAKHTDPEDSIEDQLALQFQQRFSEPSLTNAAPSHQTARVLRLVSSGKEAALRYMLRKAMLKPSVAEKDRAQKERAAIALSAAVGGKWNLSSDKENSIIVERLQAAAEDFKVQARISD